jgi:hypothetical protein
LGAPYPEELTFQAVDLPNSRSIQIGIEHFTGLNCTNLNPAMSIVDLFCSFKISWNLAEKILLGDWLFGNTNFTEEGLFVYLSSFLENAIPRLQISRIMHMRFYPYREA